MSTADIKKTAETKMGRSIESFKGELQKIRTGRAHPGMLDQIHVDYYGSPVPLSQVAALSLLDARTIGVQPWEKPMISKVEKAIRESDLGLNPSTTGEIIRVPMPALTEERRRELTKIVKHEGENAKVAVRNIRRDAIQHLKNLLKEGEVSEDEEKRAQDEVQKLTDKSIVDIDKLVAEKEKDLMAV
jgi:ribosome recycling factor